MSLLWGLIGPYELDPLQVGEGFPHGVEYSWANGVDIIRPIRCSGIQYIDYVMTWAEDLLNRDQIFPPAAGNYFSTLFFMALILAVH